MASSVNQVKIIVKPKFIEVKNQVALTPNLQGETGVMFSPETIKKAVQEYLSLISVAPYYRIMLDSHVEMGTSKWADVSGLITDVRVDEEGSARIDYTVFGGSPVYDRLLVLASMPNIGAISLSTRGYGQKVKLNPARFVNQKVKQVRLLRDSPIRYFREIGMSEKSVMFVEDFILLGWDIVVFPSQVTTSSFVLLNADKPSGVVEESGGIIRKAFGDNEVLQSHLRTGLQKITQSAETRVIRSLSMNFSPMVPPLRNYIMQGPGDLDDIEGLSNNIKTWV